MSLVNHKILELKNVSKIYSSGLIKVTHTTAVKDLSFDLNQGEILALVGESGSGKTTISNMILRIIAPNSGEIKFLDKNILDFPLKDYYHHVQVVFQDPFSSFNYFYPVDRVLKLAIKFRYGKVSRDKRKELMHRALKDVSLNPEEILGRFPHQLSGGQLQRFLLARVLIIKPELLIADEPTSMVDACARAELLTLLKKLRQKEGISIIFITHDIGQAQYISDRVIVLKNGEIVETGPTHKVFLEPEKIYTKNLLASVPSLYRKW